jgi:hypothetical protein
VPNLFDPLARWFPAYLDTGKLSVAMSGMMKLSDPYVIFPASSFGSFTTNPIPPANALPELPAASIRVISLSGGFSPGILPISRRWRAQA